MATKTSNQQPRLAFPTRSRLQLCPSAFVTLGDTESICYCCVGPLENHFVTGVAFSSSANQKTQPSKTIHFSAACFQLVLQISAAPRGRCYGEMSRRKSCGGGRKMVLCKAVARPLFALLVLYGVQTAGWLFSMKRSKCSKSRAKREPCSRHERWPPSNLLLEFEGAAWTMTPASLGLTNASCTR